MPLQSLPPRTPSWGTMITSSHNQKSFTLFNFYSPGRAEPLAAILPTLKLPNDCLLMGDLNAHHAWWQGLLPSTACISRGSQTIANWLEDNNFHLQNEPAIPTHHLRNGGCPSTIDLCFSPGSTTQSILTLAVDHNTTSDHSAISVALSLPTGTTPVAPRQCWRRANWETFDSRIQSAKLDLSQLHGMNDTLRAVTNITQLIHQAVDGAVPVKTLQKTAAPRWNHSLTLAKQSVKRADRRVRLQPTVTNLNHSRCKHSKWSTMVRNAKQLTASTNSKPHPLERFGRRLNTTTCTINQFHRWRDVRTSKKNAMFCGQRYSSIHCNQHHFPRTFSLPRKIYVAIQTASQYLTSSGPLHT